MTPEPTPKLILIAIAAAVLTGVQLVMQAVGWK
jgi:hypothetical protein